MDKFLILLLVMLYYNVSVLAENKTAKNTDNSSSYNYCDINLLGSIFFNNGFSDNSPNCDYSTGFYPKLKKTSTVFASGLIWGAKIPGYPQVRVGGTTYRTGLQPGKIISTGIAENPEAPHVRIYRVRRDIYPDGPQPELTEIAAFEEKTPEQIFQDYIKDWNEWPATYGAPFEDKNGNGTYEPAEDIPGYPGADQTLWYVANDLDSNLTNNLYGTLPIGMELQVTIWAYHQQGALDNVIFRKYRLINKSNQQWNDIHISLWSDPDLGSSTDDYAGCDTLLNLGYVYNGDDYDDVFGYTPAAVGFNLLQGPSTPNSARLPMTAFFYLTRSDADPYPITPGEPQGATTLYNFMRGRLGSTGSKFRNPITNEETTFALSGNPIKIEGWVDGMLLPPGDRRIGVCSGPFNMAPGDTQDIVVAEIAALGKNRIESVGLLKCYSALTTEIFNNDFKSYKPFSHQPVAQISQKENSLFLDWNNDTLNSIIENFESDGFSFQGYNVYQLYSDFNLKSNTRRIATFDKIDGIKEIEGSVMNPLTGYPETGIEQFGSDSGIERDFLITKDYIENFQLISGKKYYFAVTAYAYNSNSESNNMSTESLLSMVSIVYYDSTRSIHYGDTLNVQHISGQSDGKIIPIVVNPFQLTEHRYKITFNFFDYVLRWDLIDMDLDTTLLSNQTNFIADESSPVIDGFQLRVQKAADIKRISMISNGNGLISSIFGYDKTEPPSYNGYSADWYRDVLLSNKGGSTALSGGMQSAGGYYFCVAGGPNVTDHQSALRRWLRDGGNFQFAGGNTYELRFTSDGGYAWAGFTSGSLVQIPFELWNLGKTLGDQSDDVRYMPWLFDDNENDVFDFYLDHIADPDSNDPYSDWIYFMQPEENAQPGEAAYEAAVARSNSSYDGSIEIEHIARFVLMNWNMKQGNGSENEIPETGTTFRIEIANPYIGGEDEYLINSNLVNVEKAGILPPAYKLEQNYPNPFNPTTTIKFSLPQREKVSISVFDILGKRVRILLNKEMEAGSYSVRFDGSDLTSGIYFYQMICRDYIKVMKMIMIK